MLIDSHCHLPNKRYGKTVAQIIADAKKEGVTQFITIGTSIEESKTAIQTAEQFEEIFATIGIYPHEDQDKDTDSLQKQLADLLEGIRHSASQRDESPVVGIGECGIDISDWPNGRKLKDQIELFEMQLELAAVHNFPLVIHNRNGDKTILEILKSHKHQNLSGVMHCFVSSWEFAQKVLDLGFYISFSGIITYPSGVDILETVEKIPLDRFLVETDSPDLAPQGHRGEANEPKYVRIVAEKIATVKNLPIEKVSTCAHWNTCALFNLPMTVDLPL